jgi:hypothetical protein
MVNFCVMHTALFAGSKQFSYWYKALHFFYVGLYAFVLPFICLGAQATPGHPHALPHFVFVDPSVDHRSAEHSVHTIRNVADWLALYADTTICGDHSAVYQPPVAETPQQPAGRSTSAQLVISTLLLLVMSAALALLQGDGPGCCVWQVAPCVCLFCPPIPTPPPRA